MNNREANWYSNQSHPPTCSCSACTYKRLNAPPPKSKPQPYNAKKPKKKAKQTRIHADDWSKLMQALKPNDVQPPAAVTAETKTEATSQTTMSPLLKECPSCKEMALCLNDSGNLYECSHCGNSYFPSAIDKAEGENTEKKGGGKE